MQELALVTGIILKVEQIGDFDRRVVILTLERGKITAFARGARKPNSRFVASTNPFVFGKFYLYEGKNSYSLNEAEIQNYFDDLRGDYLTAYYGMYFLEISDYYTRENNDERDMLKLLYQSLRALGHGGIDNRLIRYVFEIKSLVVNGEFPGIPTGKEYKNATVYTVDFIVNARIEKLYTFTLKEDILSELGEIAGLTKNKIIHHSFKSLEILDTL